MTESYSTRRGAAGWLLRRGQPQRLGELITVSKADRQGDIESSLTGLFRVGAWHNGTRRVNPGMRMVASGVYAAATSPAMVRNADVRSGPAASGAVVPPRNEEQRSARLVTILSRQVIA